MAQPSGARSTTSAVTAACKSTSGRYAEEPRSSSPAPANLSRIIFGAWPNTAFTHLSGTPSQWRRALMVPEIRNIAPRYLRLSGEIADQAILGSLRTAFPRAAISHAYASTEAGVAFDVNDGLAGFPATYVGVTREGVDVEISDDSLRIRSRGAAFGYLGGRTGARRRGRLRRHWRYRRAAWRPLLFCRPQGRHRQYRRLEGSSGRDRGGDQPASAGAHVVGAVKGKPDHRRHRSRRRSARGGRAGRAADRTERRHSQALPRGVAASQGSRRDQLRSGAQGCRYRQTSAPSGVRECLRQEPRGRAAWS
jgi:hypothetical protein